MSDKDLQQDLTEEEVKELLKSPMAQRAKVMSEAYSEELARWESRRVELEDNIRDDIELSEWLNEEAAFVRSRISSLGKDVKKGRSKIFSLIWFKRKTKDEIDLKEFEEYLETLVERSINTMYEIATTNDEYQLHAKLKPDMLLYELGIFGENLFKPRY